MSSSRPLTPQQRLFVVEYLVDLDPEAAHARVGVDPSQRIHELPNVNAEIIRQLRLRDLGSDLTVEGLITRLLSNAEAAARVGNFAASNSAFRIIAELKGWAGKQKAAPTKKDPLQSLGFGSPADLA